MANKPKAKPSITAREKKARESRRAFERICDRIAAGEAVKQITADKTASMTERNFYYMLQAGDGELRDRYAQARATTWFSDTHGRARPMPMKSHESISITDNFCMP